MNKLNTELEEKINQTILSLCNWIVEKTENATSDNELVALPEVVKATAELIKAAKD